MTALETLAEEDLTLEMVKKRLLAEDMKQIERKKDCRRINTAAVSKTAAKLRSFKEDVKKRKA